jgi:hypothetical protein
MKTIFFRTIASIIVFASVMISSASFAQNTMDVEAKGVGVKRDDALQDALRNAIGQAAGVAMTSSTQVENFVVIKDAIASKTSGYIVSYNVTKEVPFPDRYELTVSAKVSLDPLKADIGLLAKSIGGVRFLVMYDARTVPEAEAANYEYAIERINEYLSNHKYRYIDKSRFDQLKKEAKGIMQTSETPEETYVQRIGLMADAQFIIFLKKVNVNTKSEAFDTRTSNQTSIEVKAYDNCTAEGLGTIVLESGWKGSSSGIQAGITEAVQNGFDKLLGVFNSYIGNWVNGGTPFELRFYSTGTYRDFRDLRTKLKEDSDFGGDMEIISLDNYTKLNCTFKKKPDELADKVLDIADMIPTFKEKVLDVKLIYGRQINFAPHNVTVPDLQVPAGNSGSGSTTQPKQTGTQTTPATKSTGTKTPVKGTTTTKPKTTTTPSGTGKGTGTKK